MKHEEQLRLVERGEDALSVAEDQVVEWDGLPRAATKDREIALVLTFESEEERARLVEKLGVPVRTTKGQWTTEWPVDETELRLAL